MIGGHERFNGYSLEKPDKAFRIQCVGDSMIYGQGVAMWETFPANLEFFLNRTVLSQEIEVQCAARCGRSLYTSYAEYRAVYEIWKPDLVLFLLCENDAELASSKENYYENCLNNWNPEGPVIAHFKANLDRLRKDFKDKEIPYGIVFYKLLPFPLEYILGDYCKEHNIPYLDLSNEFSSSSIPRSELAVSKVDGHPSALSHRLGAQVTSRFVAKQFFDKKQIRSIPTAKEIFEDCRNNALSRIRNGANTLETLATLKRNLSVKLMSPKLLTSELPSELLKTRLENYKRSIAWMYRRCSLGHLAKASYIHHFLDKRSFSRSFEYFRLVQNNHVRDIEVCADRVDETMLSVVSNPNSILLPENWTIVDTANTTIEEKFGSTDDLDELYDVLPGQQEIKTWVQTVTQLKSFGAQLSGARNLLGRLSNRQEKADGLDELYERQEKLEEQFQKVAQSFVRNSLLRPVQLEEPENRMEIVVTARCLSDENGYKPYLNMHASSLAPIELPALRDTQNMWVDGEVHHYRFTFPRILVGDFRLQIINPNLDYIKEFNVEKVCFHFGKETPLEIEVTNTLSADEPLLLDNLVIA